MHKSRILGSIGLVEVVRWIKDGSCESPVYRVEGDYLLVSLFVN